MTEPVIEERPNVEKEQTVVDESMRPKRKLLTPKKWKDYVIYH